MPAMTGTRPHVHSNSERRRLSQLPHGQGAGNDDEPPARSQGRHHLKGRFSHMARMKLLAAAAFALAATVMPTVGMAQEAGSLAATAPKEITPASLPDV